MKTPLHFLLISFLILTSCRQAEKTNNTAITQSETAAQKHSDTSDITDSASRANVPTEAEIIGDGREGLDEYDGYFLPVTEEGKKALAAVDALPEVQEHRNYVQQQTNNTRTLRTLLSLSLIHI